MILGGVPVTLLDTAGLRETTDPVEAEGVRRAHHRAADADLVIAIDDPTISGSEWPATQTNPGRILRVVNKIDMAQPRATYDCAISALTGAGLDALRDRLDAAARALADASGPPALTRARHRAAVGTALERLESACHASLPELRGEDLRLAMRALGRLTGTVGVEDVLDSVFRQFCIGK